MSPELFVALLGLSLALVLAVGFRWLPGERWQVIASVPTHKDAAGHWIGRNFTFYGLLSAVAEVFGGAVTLFLAAAAGVPRVETFAVAALLLTVGLLASRWVARAIEGKRHTFTVGGAVFAGILALPPIVVGVRALSEALGGEHFAVHALLAALAIGYVYGEGIGRLACISFGCCYGRPLHTLSPRIRRLFEKLSFTFHGSTKKISYAHGWEGVKVIPIQALTSVLLVGCALAATLLFLRGHYAAAFVLSVAFSQGWRAVSEFLRGDHRGHFQRISAYQVMAIAGAVYALAVGLLFPVEATARPALEQGFASIWCPSVLIALQVVGVIVFAMTGCSKVTGCSLSFHVRQTEV